jgi:hypothetical protein
MAFSASVKRPRRVARWFLRYHACLGDAGLLSIFVKAASWMSERRDGIKRFKKRFKHYHEAIRNVLLREWDPIGVADEPAAQDEYDGYIPGIIGVLIRHEPRHRLFDRLWWIETEQMDLTGDRERTDAVAGRLIGLREQIEADV